MTLYLNLYLIKKPTKIKSSHGSKFRGPMEKVFKGRATGMAQCVKTLATTSNELDQLASDLHIHIVIVAAHKIKKIEFFKGQRLKINLIQIRDALSPPASTG